MCVGGPFLLLLLSQAESGPKAEAALVLPSPPGTVAGVGECACEQGGEIGGREDSLPTPPHPLNSQWEFYYRFQWKQGYASVEHVGSDVHIPR